MLTRTVHVHVHIHVHVCVVNCAYFLHNTLLVHVHPCDSMYIFIRPASLGSGPQAHVHMEGMKCRVLYLNLLGMNALFL